MKANELRMGNSIDVGALYCPYGIGEVAEILADSVLVRINGSYHSYLFDDIQGIPLSEEFLARFGFEWSIYHQANHKEGFDFDLNESSYGGYFLSTWKKGIHVGEGLLYVHQLQNLYFALTGNELELK